MLPFYWLFFEVFFMYCRLMWMAMLCVATNKVSADLLSASDVLLNVTADPEDDVVKKSQPW